ncbi:hypothetical protein [Thalassotalea sp. SU-HH00458]|uniref:hypothetical protein n=1 Tax=Thalassotalea sp. SU-HH00458 TaxID=3127657 RepID=UPI00310552BB
MKVRFGSGQQKFLKGWLAALVVLGVSACNSSDSDDDSNQGYIKFYNASKNAPDIYLTIDEDLDTSEDDETEITFSSVGYAAALGTYEIDINDYFFELAWQDGDSSVRSELEMIYQSELSIEKDSLKLVVLNDDVTAPDVVVYDIPVIDEEDDDTYSLFNFNVLNVSTNNNAIDVYVSESDETFNEAQLLGSYQNKEISDNHKFDQGSYIFYITYSGSDEVIYQSDAVDYYYSAQYIMVIRENTGVGSSPFILDKVSNSTQVEYIDYNAEARFRIYNAIQMNDLLPDYQGEVTVYVNDIDDSPEIEQLTFGQLSEPLNVESGDYSLSLLASDNDITLVSHHLLSLSENANKTVFFYADEENVDEDGDGNVDEDGDGVVDEKEVTIHSLVIDSSDNTSIYGHEITAVNLADNEDFNLVNIYFVRSDETIDSAYYNRSFGYAEHETLYLTNNTYQVYVVAKENSSNIILDSFELVLDEESTDQFIVIENDLTSGTGYKANMFSRSSD